MYLNFNRYLEYVTSQTIYVAYSLMLAYILAFCTSLHRLCKLISRICHRYPVQETKKLLISYQKKRSMCP